jgi:hypothetical protein
MAPDPGPLHSTGRDGRRGDLTSPAGAGGEWSSGAEIRSPSSASKVIVASACGTHPPSDKPAGPGPLSRAVQRGPCGGPQAGAAKP